MKNVPVSQVLKKKEITSILQHTFGGEKTKFSSVRETDCSDLLESC